MQYKKNLTEYEYLEGWERSNLSEQLEKWAKKYADRIAIVDKESRLTYSELNSAATELATSFQNDGIKSDDRVIVQLPNKISFVIVFFSLIRIGAVPIMVLPAHREAELKGIIQIAEPTAYICAEKYLGFNYIRMVRDLKKRFSYIKNIYVDGESEEKCKILLRSIQNQKYTDFPMIDGYKTAVLLLSGGTTGIPKLIPRTHADYMYNARMSAKRCELNENDVYLASLPIAHNFPLCCPGLLGTLDAGGKVVLAHTTSPDAILEAITKEKVTITALVPAIVTVCMEMLDCDDGYDISSLKILQVGGAMLEDALAREIVDRLPCKLMQVFGTAEGLLSFTSPADNDEIVVRCQGVPISPADEVRIVNSIGEDVKSGEYGELLSRGPYTIDEYFKAPDSNKESFTEDGFYKTGDRAKWTEDGKLRIGGRLKEQINRAGEKIMPAEIEEYLCRHDRIREAAVVGIVDKEMGSRSCAFVVTNDGEPISMKEIVEHFTYLGVAKYKFPDQLENIEVWPLTSVGKIDKNTLVKLVTEEV